MCMENMGKKKTHVACRFPLGGLKGPCLQLYYDHMVPRRTIIVRTQFEHPGVFKLGTSHFRSHSALGCRKHEPSSILSSGPPGTQESS